ncbi:hypothetical protein GCM10027299_57600 [Larkinella ripae]
MIQLRARTNLLFASGPAPLDVDISLATGSLTGLYGPSGSGKTSLLRILAGLMVPEEGLIRVEDRIWLDTGQRINLPTQRRKVGMVFQDSALFPNMSVRQNVEFAAENRRDPLIDELLERVGLTKLADRQPASLSGGQRQRVALVRALARRPQLLLLDEPFSALDRETRDQLLAELLSLHQRFGTTTVLVSHQQEEILRVADQLLELKQGKAFWVEIGPGQKTLPEVTGQITAVQLESGQARIEIRLHETTVTLEMPVHQVRWQVGDPITLPVSPPV